MSLLVYGSLVHMFSCHLAFILYRQYLSLLVGYKCWGGGGAGREEEGREEERNGRKKALSKGGKAGVKKATGDYLPTKD